MRRKTGIEKRILQHRLKKITIAIVCLLGMTLLLVQCKKETPPGTGTPATTAPSVADGTATVLDGSPPPTTVTETQPGSDDGETATPTGTPEPTPTPTEGEKAAAFSAQESSDSYVSNPNDCIKAVQSEQMEGCVSLESVQDVTHAVWEQLFPDTEFYVLHLSNNNRIYGYTTYYRLAARQDDRQYTAETFDQLLSVNNVRVADENYELVAQAFALMTLNAEIFSYQIVFTEWEPIDLQDAFSHFDRRLQAWTELGGQENHWRFGFEEGKMMEIMGPYVFNTEVGNYVPLPDIVDESRSYASGLPLQYRFFFD